MYIWPLVCEDEWFLFKFKLKIIEFINKIDYYYIDSKILVYFIYYKATYL